MSTTTFGFIGLGLIGGSIARAIREKHPDARIIAYDINEAALNAANADGVIDTPATAIDETFTGCDFLFLCAPVQKNDENLRSIKKFLSKECILTDVGSVKTAIHEAIEAEGLEEQFIGGHPMTGSERVGYANSKAILLENAFYILTPTGKVSDEAVAKYTALVKSLGAIPLTLDYHQHDYVTAAISHLPHVIASALVNLVKDSDSEEGTMKLIAAGGFKDITRIASSSPDMWQQICLTNTANLSMLLEDYIIALKAIKEKLDAKDGVSLREFFDSARVYRDSFNVTSSGPIKRRFVVHIDIADKAGSLAYVATLLADHKISIKNIGIAHNREAESGVLQIEFYDAASVEQACSIFRENKIAIMQKQI